MRTPIKIVYTYKDGNQVSWDQLPEGHKVTVRMGDKVATYVSTEPPKNEAQNRRYLRMAKEDFTTAKTAQ